MARPCVAHVVHSVQFGGMEEATLRWLAAPAARRYEHHLLCLATHDGGESELARRAAALGVPVASVPWGRGRPLLAAARTLARFARERGVTLVHAQNTYADLIAALAAMQMPLRTVASAYVWWSGHGWRRDLLNRLDAWSLRRMDLVAAQCEATREECRRRGVPAGRLRIAISGQALPDPPPGPDAREAARAGLGAAPGDVVVAKLARFWPDKRHDLALEAFRQVALRCPRARFWLAGVGPTLEATRALAARLGLADRVRFVGFVSPAGILPGVDVLASASDAEGVPLALTEAMAHAVPIVATRVGGVPEVVAHGESGLLVAPGDPEALAGALATLVDDGRARGIMGASARDYIARQYSPEVAARQMAAIYDELLDR